MIENHSVELFSIQKACDEIVAAASDLFSQCGYPVIRSFDLQRARASQSQCKCPHHGTELCDCQMIIMLIYGIQQAPVTLIFHGHDGWTYLSLAENPGQEISQESASILQGILSPIQNT
jgi:hypothetical protein